MELGALALAEQSAIGSTRSAAGLQKPAHLVVGPKIGGVCRTSWPFVDFAFADRLRSGRGDASVSAACSLIRKR